MTEQTFTQSCHKPYDRHYYILRLEGGGSSVWEDYEELRDHWMLNRGWGMTHIEVMTRQQPKKKAEPKGF